MFRGPFIYSVLGDSHPSYAVHVSDLCVRHRSKSCIEFFEDLDNGRGTFASKHTDEFKENIAEEKFEEIKSDVNEKITKANPSSIEKFELWMRRRQNSEAADGVQDDSMLICGQKKIELIDLAVDMIMLFQCVYLAIVLTENGEVTLTIEEGPRIVWRVVMILPGFLILFVIFLTIKVNI